MAGDTALSTVFRSNERNAETTATAIKNLLVDSGVQAEVYAHEGAQEGTWEVRVAAADTERAQGVIASAGYAGTAEPDQSPELDFVSVRTTEGALGEMEATSIQSVLDAAGINCVVVGSSTLPNLRFDVRVSRSDLEQARQVLQEAEEAGPAAAEAAAEESVAPDQKGA